MSAEADMVPKRVDSTNQKRLPANAHAHRAVFQARLPWDEIVKLKLKFSQYPSIHTNYIISHCTTLQYIHNIWHGT